MSYSIHSLALRSSLYRSHRSPFRVLFLPSEVVLLTSIKPTLYGSAIELPWTAATSSVAPGSVLHANMTTASPLCANSPAHQDRQLDAALGLWLKLGTHARLRALPPETSYPWRRSRSPHRISWASPLARSLCLGCWPARRPDSARGTVPSPAQKSPRRA